MKNYFSHDFGARNDPKLIKVHMRLGLAGIGAYWALVEMLHEEDGYLMLSDCESYAFALRTDCELLHSLINDFELFKKDAEKFWSESALERIQRRKAKSEKAAQSARNRWFDANAMRTHSDGNAVKGKESKVKEKKEYRTNVAASAAEKKNTGLVSSEFEKSIQACQTVESLYNFFYSLQPGPDKNSPEVALLAKRKEEILSFDAFWLAYDHKVGSKVSAKTIWDKLQLDDRLLIISKLDVYKKNNPDKQYRPHPERFLKKKYWQAEDFVNPPKKENDKGSVKFSSISIVNQSNKPII